jgi:hypothetical protein
MDNYKFLIKKKIYSVRNRLFLRPGRCIFIACFAKSGSTFLSKALSNITGYRHGHAMQFAKHNEQDIYERRLRRLLRSDAIIQQHAKATENNVKLMLKYDIRPIILVRNIFDTLISHYDHIENLDPRTPIGYVHSEYFTMDKEQKLDYLIKVHLPWFFNFFVSWREAEKHLPLYWLDYGILFENKEAQIAKILDYYRLDYEPEKITVALGKIKQHRTRFNKGIAGRGRRLNDRQTGLIRDLAAAYRVKKGYFEMIGL